jgi:hypothetical protein
LPCLEPAPGQLPALRRGEGHRDRPAEKSTMMEHVREPLSAIAKSAGIREADLKLAEAAAVIRTEPPDPDDLAYMARELIQCTLPHSDPGAIPGWVRKNGDLTLAIVPGVDHVTRKSYGYPYGSIPRLLLYWMTHEAVRTRQRRLELGDTLAEFMRQIGLDPRGGGKRSDGKRLRDQMSRLFRSTISFEINQQTRNMRRHAWMDMQVAPEGELWWDPRQPDQATLWGSWILLGERFFQAITAAPVPLDSRALRALKRSPLALDLYAWACHKVFQVKRKNRPECVSWKDLHAQFGSDYTNIRHFKAKVLATLRKISQVYPELRYECMPYQMWILPTSDLAIRCPL